MGRGGCPHCPCPCCAMLRGRPWPVGGLRTDRGCRRTVCRNPRRLTACSETQAASRLRRGARRGTARQAPSRPAMLQYSRSMNPWRGICTALANCHLREFDGWGTHGEAGSRRGYAERSGRRAGDHPRRSLRTCAQITTTGRGHPVSRSRAAWPTHRGTARLRHVGKGARDADGRLTRNADAHINSDK